MTLHIVLKVPFEKAAPPPPPPPPCPAHVLAPVDVALINCKELVNIFL